MRTSLSRSFTLALSAVLTIGVLLLGVGPADGIPILGGEHHGVVILVTGCDDDQFQAVEPAVALEKVGVVPQQVFGG